MPSLFAIAFGVVFLCASTVVADDKPREINIAFKADDVGKLREIVFNGTVVSASNDGKRTSLQMLHNSVVDVIFDPNGVRRPQKCETFVEADAALLYGDFMAALEAITFRRSQSDRAPEVLVDSFRLVIHEVNEGRTTLDLQLFFAADAPAANAAESSVLSPPEEPIVLQINRDGQVHYGGDGFVAPDIIRRRLATKKSFLHNSGHDFKATPIIIRAEMQCTTTQVGAVLAAGRSPGFRIFAFRTASPRD